MKCRTLLLAALALATTGCGPFEGAPGRPSPDSRVIPPSEIMDFDLLYGKSCAGCHGPHGRGGAAIGVGDPVYLSIADDAAIFHVTAEGVPGTAMPAFAQTSGGMLTTKQIDAIIGGMRASWGGSAALDTVDPPSYRAQTPGDPKRGAKAYAFFCSSCHGSEGRGGTASSIVDGSYLALVSDQGLRTIVIVGRPELGAPDWRGNVPHHPMSSEDVSDVVAWLAEQRPRFPGQPYASAQRTAGEPQ